MLVIQKAVATGGRVVALGTFDGVHTGHQALICDARKLADTYGVPLRVCTFDRHPLEILQPDNPPELLSTVPEKAEAMYRLGVDEMEMMPFDKTTAGMDPEIFLEWLRSRMNLRAVVAGWNYSFGYKGRGNAEMLVRDGERHRYHVKIVPPVRLNDGTAVSSSLVRKKLQEGLVEEATELLGRCYSLTGSVAHGKHQGHSLGFPTANIEPWRRKALPKFGVYTCMLETETGTFHAVVNVGVQPTLPSGKVSVEAHALEECPELYGTKARIKLIKMLREERRFDSPEALKEQIERDRKEALALFGMA